MTIKNVKVEKTTKAGKIEHVVNGVSVEAEDYLKVIQAANRISDTENKEIQNTRKEVTGSYVAYTCIGVDESLIPTPKKVVTQNEEEKKAD